MNIARTQSHHDKSFSETADRDVLPAPVLLAPRRRLWPGLPGMPSLRRGLLLRLCGDAADWPAGDARRYAIRESAEDRGLGASAAPAPHELGHGQESAGANHIYGFVTIIRIHLPHDAADVVLHGEFRQIQVGGDLFVGQASFHQADELELPAREAILPISRLQRNLHPGAI